jgi:hypothetical protein
MTYAVQLTIKSRNAKVGPIPVSTTAAKTCPPACPFFGGWNGCYADGGPLGMMWRALSKAVPGEAYDLPKGKGQSLDWQGFTDAIRALPEGQLWRHNQAGDLPGEGNAVDADALDDLVTANMGKRGFTYTHKPLTVDNAASIAHANANGFTVNLSGNNLAHADTLANAAIGPVVVVLPVDADHKADIRTPEGRKVAICPATYRDEVSCASCQLCQRADRKVIVGFPAHGMAKRKASNVATS